MKVLNSEKAFREHYAKKAGDVFAMGAAFAGGSAVSGVFAGGSALAAGHAAAAASVWSLGANLPLVGAFCAGKAAAVGAAATTAALTSAPVLIPAAALGLDVAGAIYFFTRDDKPMQKGSSVSELAHAFARVACLPMLACAVSFCLANPECEPAVRGTICSEMGAWGYSEAYVREGIDEAMRHSPQEINGRYGWAVRQLAAGSTEGIGATPVELLEEAVCAFADEFKEIFEACLG